jgi:hypothetical protein
VLAKATFVLESKLFENPSGGWIIDETTGVDSAQTETLEPMVQKSACRLRAITITPERHSHPISQLGSIVRQFEIQTNASAEAIGITHDDGEAGEVGIFRDLLQQALSVFDGVGMGDAQSHLGDLARTYEVDEIGDVSPLIPPEQ